MPILSSDSYGKSGVRLTKVTRNGDIHDIKEMNVAIELHGEFGTCYTEGDNSMVIPTDTMKNTVYALAKKHDFASIEEFATILGKHFVEEFEHVSSSKVTIEQTLWNRIPLDGKPHEHSFIGGSGETRNCIVETTREGTRTQGGLDGMTVLKTTKSGFVEYIKDQYTTLRPTTERIFATIVQANWLYNSPDADFTAAYESIRDALVRVFADHDSLAVQQTLFEMGAEALKACETIDEISFVLPNQHRILMNLEPFGMENNNEIFIATSEPYGRICGTIRRE